MFKIYKIAVTLLLIVFSSSFIFCQKKHVLKIETKTEQLPFGFITKSPTAKPSLGLALSGGGSRGISQIGVLQAFEDAEINIDIIVGTSMGSVIGGLYSAGYSTKLLDSIATTTNWDDLVSIKNEISRRELFIDQKVTKDRSIFTLRLDGLTPVIPTSFNEGTKLSNFLTLLSFKAPVQVVTNFDELPIKYRAVCTDLISGKPVILRSGSLGRAMRASSSVTFFLSPVKWDSLTLVDGGLVANIPVEQTINEGADIVIAVNSTSPLHNLEALDAPWIIADQTVSIPMKQLDLNQLRQADFVIEPGVKERESIDFKMIDSLIISGYVSAKEQTDKIKKVIDSLVIINLGGTDKIISNLKIKNKPSEPSKLIYEKYISKRTASENEILKDIYDLFITGEYKTISAEIIKDQENTTLEFIYEANPVIRSVDVIGMGEINVALINPILKNLIDKPLNEKLLVKNIIELLSVYKEKGFLLASFSGHNFDDSTGKLTLEFHSGTISELRIKSETRTEIVEREFNIKAGDNFNYEEVKTGLDNLRSSGLYDDIHLQIIREDGENIISLEVEDKIPQMLTVGFLADNVYNAQLGLELRDINLFGSGSELGLILFGGASNRAYILEHIAHRVLNTYLTYKINAYYKFNGVSTYSRTLSESQKSFTSTKVGEYRQIFYGTSLSVGTQIQKFGKLIFTGKYQFDQIKNQMGEGANQDKTKIVSLRIGAIIDNQDKYPYPEQGVYFNGYYETAQSFLGGDEGFLVLGIDLRYIWSVSESSVIIPKIQIGFADKTLPLSEQFTMGGQYSFFGAHENEFRGRQIFLISAMYQYRLPFSIFFDTYLSLRYDIGSTWEEQEEIRLKDLRHGIGGTVSFDTPIGPADFSVGRSFLFRNVGSGPSISWGDVLFYFSIGYAINF